VSIDRKGEEVRTIQAVLCILLVVAAIVLGIYLGVWVCFIGGIVKVIESAKHTPVESMGIAKGIVQFAFSGFIGWGTVIAGGIMAKLLWPGPPRRF
jgi:hypothetical protein